MILPLYQIEGWNDYFENAKSRTYDRCQYVVSPNKHGGSGWSNVMGEPDGAAIWGIWKMLLDVCSRQRKPREGWLTSDGKKNGRRLTQRELSNQLRRPIEEIYRALKILRSPEVSFITLVDGQAEGLAGIPEGYQEDSPRASEEYPTRAPAQDTAVSVEYPSTILSDDIESKKESKKHSLSRGQGNTEETDTSSAADGHQPDTSGIAEGQQPDTAVLDLVHAAEAKLILNKLAKDVFPDEEPGSIWKNDLDHELCEVLPVKRAVLEYVDWAYRLPASHRLFQDKGGGGMMRRRSFRTLIPNLKSEASKIRDARKKIGLNGLHEESTARKAEGGSEPWTDELRSAALALYGSQARLAECFSQMPASAQSEIRRKAAEVPA